VRDVAGIPDSPPPGLKQGARGGALASLVELIGRRDLVWTLAKRDFTARYKQTVLGVGWAVLLPLLTITVFASFVQRYAHAQTHGVPYLVWSFLGLLPWNLFTNSVNTGGLSLIANQPLLNKVYSPRQIYPVAAVLLASIDALISAGVLAVVFAVTTTAPAVTLYWAPLLIAVELVFTTAVTVLVSIVVVYVRDLRNIIPTALQLGLFATPVVFGLDQVAPGFRLFYCFLNPMAPVIDGLRRTVLYGQNPDAAQLGAGAASTFVLLLISFRVFRRLERGIVDII
jgi:ABC-type polysaccharide/polyol phosphate export permease